MAMQKELVTLALSLTMMDHSVCAVTQMPSRHRTRATMCL
jgi:hypothetical protein